MEYLSTAMTRLYTKPAGISLLIHVSLLCLAMLITGRTAPVAPVPSPIEVEIEPARLLDMGGGNLHIASGSPPPGSHRAARPKVRTAAAKAAPEPAFAKPVQATAPVSRDEAPPPLHGDVSESSVGVPLQGDKVAEGWSAGSGAADSGGRGAGNAGAGTGASAGDGEGGGYAGAGVGYGPLPVYPSSARRAGREGVVVVRVLVGPDGKPVSVTVRATSGHEDFDSAAIEGVKRWRFSPARRGKEAVASFLDVRVRFRLDEAR